MMFWYDHGVSGWGWFAMSVGMILFWVVVIGFGVLLYRALSDSGAPGGRPGSRAPHGHAAEQLLAERFARGEIDEDEYRKRVAALREVSSSGPPPRD